MNYPWFIFIFSILCVLVSCVSDNFHSPTTQITEQEEESIITNAKRLLSTHGVSYHPIRPPPGKHLSIFIHSVVSDFGLAILEEMLEIIRDRSKLFISGVKNINVGILGDLDGRKKAMSIIGNYSESFNTNDVKVSLVIEGTAKRLVEFPTLFAFQTYAALAHEDSLLLYLHTKGVNRRGQYGDWRRLLMYYYFLFYIKVLKIKEH